mgnify:CR=1 FL=1
MKSATKHIVISTVLCALTLVVFLAFYNRLPETIPIHFDSAGVANSFWPRNVVVFGVPVACVLLNLVLRYRLRLREFLHIFLAQHIGQRTEVHAVISHFLAADKERPGNYPVAKPAVSFHSYELCLLVSDHHSIG